MAATAPTDPFERLTACFSGRARLAHAQTYLSWDQMVMMPPGGNEARSATLAELATLSHRALIADEVGEWLEAAGQELAGADPDSPHTRLQRARLVEMGRERREAVALPGDLVRARVVAGSRCEAGWRVQRPANDWTGFLENFAPVVALSREAAEAYREAGGHASRYEAMMALYCTGDDPARTATLFGELERALPPLLQEVVEHQAGSPVPRLDGPFPVAGQVALGRRLAARLGFDFERGRLDTSLHPFSTGSRGDLRITTRYREQDCFDALQATAHEIGHASYEGGLPEAFADEPVGQSRSMSVHESQSLFFEKHLFLSRAFLQAFAPDVRAALPGLAGTDAHTLWRSQLGVGPSLVRVEADEVTYPLHVLLRHGIERALIDGELEAQDVPGAWDERMQALLGLDTRGNHTDGCLQDIHWSDGSFGYFPSYTLGAINAASIAAAIDRDLPGWRDGVATGRDGAIEPLREWLGARVWSRASTVDASTLMSGATGGVPGTQALLSHLRRRYLDEAV